MDFEVKTPAIDPSAIANILQRKSALEFDQSQQLKKSQNDRVTRILEAVQTGQKIAANMMSLAEARSQKEGLDQAIKLSQPDPTQATTSSFGTVPVKPEMDPETRKQKLISALMQAAGPEKAAAAGLGHLLPKAMSGSASRPTPMGLELPDGSQALGYFDPTDRQYHLDNGEVAPQGTKRAYKYDLREDSSGNLVVSSGASGKAVNQINLSAGELPTEKVGTVNSIWALPPKEKVAAEKAIDEYTKEPTVRAARSSFLATGVTMRGLEARNFVFDEKLGLQLARGFGDAGNISIVEQEVGRESRQLVEKGKQLIERYIKTGELTEDNRIEVLRALKTLQYAQLQRLEGEADIVVDRVTGEQGEIPRLNPEKFKRKLIGERLQENMNKAREQLGRLDDLTGDIDITTGSKEGEKGSRGKTSTDVSVDEAIAKTKAEIDRIKKLMEGQR